MFLYPKSDWNSSSHPQLQSGDIIYCETETQVEEQRTRTKRNAVSSGESLCGSIISRCWAQSHGSEEVRPSEMTGGMARLFPVTNELFTREWGSTLLILTPLCLLGIHSSALWETDKHRTGENDVAEPGQVSVGAARTSLGWINITLWTWLIKLEIEISANISRLNFEKQTVWYFCHRFRTN